MTQHGHEGTVFRSQKFTEFSSMKESLTNRKIDATFMIAPLAMKLVHDGVPVKLVYLGHRDGTALVVHSEGPIRSFPDLVGKRVAIPSVYSNQNYFLHREMRKHGIDPGQMTIVEIPPPEHPTTLYAGGIDAYIIGEPHAARAEMDGFGRVLMHMRDAWPNFVSCVLVVREEVILERRELVEELVRGIATSGKWLDSDRDQGAQHRKDAAMVAGKIFYNQKPELLEYVLTRPTDRVSYTGLLPPKESFDEIMEMALSLGHLSRRMEFEEYADTSFAPDLETLVVPFDRLPRIDEVTRQ